MFCSRTACRVSIDDQYFAIYNDPSTGKPRPYCVPCGRKITEWNPTLDWERIVFAYLKDLSVGELFQTMTDRKKVYRLLQSGEVQMVLSQSLEQWDIHIGMPEKMDRLTQVTRVARITVE